MGEQLQNERWLIDVEPEAGGRLAGAVADGTELIVRRTDLAVSPTTLNWGSYPMIPWAGRIRDGRFRFDGREVQLPINFGHHAIHGVGMAAAWNVVGTTATTIDLDLSLPSDMRWPFGGTARQRFELDGPSLLMTLSVTAGDRPFPASFGWHPWFRQPDAVDFRPSRMYRRDADHLAVDELVDVPPGPWDDCFLNDQPVDVTIDGTRVRLTSDCDHWVVYDEPAHATCIEPQTGPPDAPNIRPRIVAPGTTLSAWFRLTLIGDDHSARTRPG